ncbi:hypothetical protein JXB31_03835 [Candidatus Woesearchaeota archaeon]|nr:hypothetical protein [Candidatus Woesearchaeota archaeon]
MRSLVVFYSRTGTTRTVAHEIRKCLGSDICEIKADNYPRGPIGYLMAGWDAMAKKLPDIKYHKGMTGVPSGYDVVLIGTPVWGFTMASPVRSYITQNKGRFRKLAFFCTQGGSGSDQTFSSMEELSGLKASAKLALTKKRVKQGSYLEYVKGFTGSLNGS